jgi:hypothetical protein
LKYAKSLERNAVKTARKFLKPLLIKDIEPHKAFIFVDINCKEFAQPMESFILWN